MRIFSSVIIMLCTVMLIACVGKPVSKNYTTTAVAACKKSCQESYHQCRKVCHNSCRNCAAYEQQVTAKHYRNYTHEQCVEGGFVIRQLNSYRDPLKCRKTTCDCEADYQICSQACSGIIHKYLQVAPTCC